MRKKQIISTVVLAMIFSLLGMQAFSVNIEKADAVTTAIVNPYNNQSSVDAKADQIIQTAKSLIGKATYATTESLVSTVPPYRFRCASFINFVFNQNGVDLATADENSMFQEGYSVPRDQLQKGDLVFFDSTPTNNDPTNHVGLYIGDNKIIHMADSKLNVVISDLNSTSYYRDSYVGARRVLPSLLSANPATKGDQIVSTAFALRDKVTISSTTNDNASLTFTNGGLVNYIFMKNGINLGTTNIKDQIKLGEEVSYNNLQKGDLVFFNYTTGSTTPGIVAIYAGDHRLILASPTSGFYTRVDSLDWYKQHYITARRVLPSLLSANPATKGDQIVSTAFALRDKVTISSTTNDNASLTFTNSGLVNYIFMKNGINLGTTNIKDQIKLGEEVSYDNLEKGDLVFFNFTAGSTTPGRVAIYAGDHQLILSSSTSGFYTSVDSLDWYKQHYITARRVW